MIGIVVAFPNKENAANIRNLLMRQGFTVTGVCTTGAQVLTLLEDLEYGIVICGYKLKDMIYSDLREYLPADVEMLMIASREKWSDGLADGVVGLPMPIKAYDMVSTLEMMLEHIGRRRKKRRQAPKKRTREEQETIGQAKALLMEHYQMSEEEAHRYLQKHSMENGTNMVETAEMVQRILPEQEVYHDEVYKDAGTGE